MTAPAETRARPRERARRRGRRRRGEATVLIGFTWAVIGWLTLPIATMIAFGFNDTNSRFNYRWQGFTLRWYRDLFAIPNLTSALQNSFTIAIMSTVIATVLGTGVGLALARYRFRGRGSVDLLLFASIAAPEIVMGASLLAMFVSLGVPRGYWTIVIGHVMFCIAYVAVTVRARAVGVDRSLEEAARDLGAGPFTTFRLVTLPMILPGVVSGALLSFALSIDDYILTSFNAGRVVTFPLWVYSATRHGIPPQVNVMGTLIFAIGVALAAANGLLLQRRRRSSA